MKFNRYFLTILVVLIAFAASAVAQEMPKKDWEQQMSQTTAKRNELKSKLDKLNADIEALKSGSSKLDADLAACEEELFNLLGMTRDQVNAFDNELGGYEARADELMRLSDADLLKHREEIEKMSNRVNEMAASKVGQITRFKGRLATLKGKIESLKNTLAKAGIVSVYTVGTWAKDRDCLWNIAKKPNIYGNAWLWPKIWQGNKDKIKDPDIIHPGWKLNIPAGKELTKDEKAAANSYYRKKAGG